MNNTDDAHTITTNNRLPRYQRAETEVPCVLTPRDLEILKHVESFRLLTSDHVRLLVPGSDQGILRRLQVLFHDGYLDRPRPRYVNGGGSAKMIYAITNKGAQTLQKAGLIERRAKTDLNAQNKDVGDLFIAHRLLVSHIRTVLTAACNARPDLELVSWREGKEIMDTIEVALPETYATVPIAADGFFTIRDAQGRTHYFVEADRGSMPIKRFTRKLQGYAAYAKAQKHTEKFGIKKFRVLTVTSSHSRCRNLVNAASAVFQDLRDLHNKFLFATEAELPLQKPEKIFDKIWLRLDAAQPCSLGLVQESQNERRSCPMQKPSNVNPEAQYGP
jgi:hypothetical protein